MKTIGVLGEVGPQATMDFEQRFHRAAQRLIPPHLNSGYPPMFVCYLRHPPVRVSESGPTILPIEANPGVFERAKELGAVSDFLVITSNGVHLFKDEIERAAGKPVLSMIDLTLAEVQRRGWKRVGVLGMGEPVVYTRPMRKLGIESEVLDAESREQLNRAIIKLMEGREYDETLATTRRSIQLLRDRNVDGIILGCTELPLLLHADDLKAADLLDPLDLLAEAAVRRAIA
ncbi:MAG: amino acid racemase [Anaerolineae bacterium]|nr:amino acid racemase [Phycisphaerae bacterium]